MDRTEIRPILFLATTHQRRCLQPAGDGRLRQSLWGSRHGCEPETLRPMNRFKKLIEIRWLHYVAVRIEIVTPNNVFLGAGGRENYHWNSPQLRITLDLRENFASVLAWQVEVQNDQVGLSGVFVGTRPA